MTAPVIVASLGTFHLRFNRMVDWIESWHAKNPEATIILQHGVSRPMQGAENHKMMTPAQLLDLYRTADVVVLQGGAGGIMDAREAHRFPIVVARTAALNEMIDDHQVTFMGRLAQQGHIHLAASQEHLHRLIDGALDGSTATRLDSVTMTAGATNLVSLLEDPIPTLTAKEMWQRTRWSIRQLARGSRPIAAEPGRFPSQCTPPRLSRRATQTSSTPSLV